VFFLGLHIKIPRISAQHSEEVRWGPVHEFQAGPPSQLQVFDGWVSRASAVQLHNTQGPSSGIGQLAKRFDYGETPPRTKRGHSSWLECMGNNRIDTICHTSYYMSSNKGRLSLPQERHLLRRARALDEQALSAIFDMYYPLLYRYIYHQVGHTTTAEDLTADVFIRLLKQLRSGHGPDRRLKPWLYRVAHNLVVDHWRRDAHRDHDQLDEELPAVEEGTEQQAQRAILRQQARAALDTLTDKQRAVIILKFLEGMDNAEIAEVLEMTVGAAKALQSRGLAAMRSYLVRSGAVTEDQT
ncbi:MAG: RNA polymerase sigma factor, partial [Dehalococcoidia bacterium]